MQLLPLLCLFFFSLVLSSPSDVLYIQKLFIDNVQLLDAKDFAGLVNIFTKDSINNPGVGPNIIGIENIQATLATIYPPEVITQTAISTQSVTLLPPFDEQGAAGTASSVDYVSATYIGQGNLTGQALVGIGKFNHKYAKTGDFALHGGWRISESYLTLFVSCAKVDQLRT